MNMKSQTLRTAIACLLLPGAAAAQESWENRVAIYGYFPDIGGQTSFAAPGGGEFEIANNDLIRNTDIALMTSIEEQKGRIGIFGELIYMIVDYEIGGVTWSGLDAVAIAQGSLVGEALHCEVLVLA